VEHLALVFALVGVLGIGAQWLAWRSGLPAIVLMLAAGLLAGPVFGVIDPRSSFGDMLEPMVSIGVALILFEGGLSLDFRELNKFGEGVWRLVIFGIPIGWLLGSLACYYVAGLVWPVAILFAGILVVTGPTVVLPLLRQTSVKQRPSALLRWEAIVNDPLGAMCAVIAYEYFRLSAGGTTSLFEVVPPMLIAVLVAGGIGWAAAWLIAWSFPRGYVPEFLKAPVLLVAVVGAFVLCNMIEHEAGLVAVTVMGIALANMHASSLRSIHPFKQNVAVLLVSGIFVLLSASLNVEQLRQLEWRFGLFLLALIFVVRPATVLLSLLFTKIPWKERLFVAWIAPRGIVMVAVSGLFALRLSDLGYGDGSILIGLSFSVVVATILAHGFTIGPVARWLGVMGTRRPGLLIVGSNDWTVALAKQMQELGTPVMVADSSWQRLAPARKLGLPTFHGEILNEASGPDLDLAPFKVLVAATENEAYNALVCNEFGHAIGRDAVYQLGDDETAEDYRRLPASLRGRALFHAGFGVGDVQERQKQGWVFRRTRISEKFGAEDAKGVLPEGAHMLLLLRKSGNMRFFTHASAPEPAPGDIVISYAPPTPKRATGSATKRAARRQPKASAA